LVLIGLIPRFVLAVSCFFPAHLQLGPHQFFLSPELLCVLLYGPFLYSRFFMVVVPARRPPQAPEHLFFPPANLFSLSSLLPVSPPPVPDFPKKMQMCPMSRFFFWASGFSSLFFQIPLVKFTWARNQYSACLVRPPPTPTPKTHDFISEYNSVPPLSSAPV